LAPEWKQSVQSLWQQQGFCGLYINLSESCKRFNDILEASNMPKAHGSMYFPTAIEGAFDAHLESSKRIVYKQYTLSKLSFSEGQLACLPLPRIPGASAAHLNNSHMVKCGGKLAGRSHSDGFVGNV